MTGLVRADVVAFAVVLDRGDEGCHPHLHGIDQDVAELGRSAHFARWAGLAELLLPPLPGCWPAEDWIAFKTVAASEGVRHDEIMASRNVERASSTSAGVVGAVCSHVGRRDRTNSVSALLAAVSLLLSVSMFVLVSRPNEKSVPVDVGLSSRKLRLLLLTVVWCCGTKALAEDIDAASRAMAAAVVVVLRRWFVLVLALLDIGCVIDPGLDTAAAVEGTLMLLRGRLLPGDGGHVLDVMVIDISRQRGSGCVNCQ